MSTTQAAGPAYTGQPAQVVFNFDFIKPPLKAGIDAGIDAAVPIAQGILKPQANRLIDASTDHAGKAIKNGLATQLSPAVAQSAGVSVDAGCKGSALCSPRAYY